MLWLKFFGPSGTELVFIFQNPRLMYFFKFNNFVRFTLQFSTKGDLLCENLNQVSIQIVSNSIIPAMHRFKSPKSLFLRFPLPGNPPAQVKFPIPPHPPILYCYLENPGDGAQHLFKISAVTVKKHRKVDIKMFLHCPILLNFSILFQILCFQFKKLLNKSLKSFLVSGIKFFVCLFVAAFFQN